MVILYADGDAFKTIDIRARIRIGQIDRFAQRKLAVGRIHHVGDGRDIEDRQQTSIFQRFESAEPMHSTHAIEIISCNMLLYLVVRIPVSALITASQTPRYPARHRPDGPLEARVDRPLSAGLRACCPRH